MAAMPFASAPVGAATAAMPFAKNIAAIAAPTQSGPPSPFEPVYIVSSRDTFENTLRPLARDPRPRIDSLGHPVVISRLQSHQLEDAARLVHERERRCGGYFAFPTRAAAEEFLQADGALRAVHAQAAVDYTVDQQPQVEQWMEQVSEPAIRDTILYLSTQWPNRYYNSNHGRDSAEWIAQMWQALGEHRNDTSVELFKACLNCGIQPSVILTIEGANRPDEIVVLGGHLDSISNIGTNDNMDAPGADDNASGIAVLTEALRIALASGWYPQRTIKVMGYAAEEVGLRGAYAIANQHRALGKHVVGVLQLDMTNFTTSDTTLDLRLVSDYSSPTLQQFVRDLFDTYLAPMGHTRSSFACGYACSDHAAWTAAGFPSAFVAEPVLFPLRHSIHDAMPVIGNNANVSVPFAQLALAFMAELGKPGIYMVGLPYCRPSQDPTSNLFAGNTPPAPVGAATAATPSREPSARQTPRR